MEKASIRVSAAIVLYENDQKEIENVIKSCLQSEKIDKLYLIDNSKENKKEQFLFDARLCYIHNGKNLGFGAAHNVAIAASLNDFDYHIIINPDIIFEPHVIGDMLSFMETHPDIGNLMPKILYPSGELQRLCKLLPNPMHLFARRFGLNGKWVQSIKKEYELQMFDYDQIRDIPNLSGCFMFIRTSVLKKVGGFDQRYFMYLEDVDLVRRIGGVARTVFFPKVSVYHVYHKRSYKNGKLLWLHIISAIKYFNKWGWFFDKERNKVNKITLDTITKHK